MKSKICMRASRVYGFLAPLSPVIVSQASDCCVGVFISKKWKIHTDMSWMAKIRILEICNARRLRASNIL